MSQIGEVLQGASAEVNADCHGLRDRRLASILGAVIELRYRRAGVDSEARTRPCPRFRPPDLRGSSARRPRWASHCLAAPHDVRRTVSGAPAARSCGEPLRCNEEGLSQRTAAAETVCRTGPAPFT